MQVQGRLYRWVPQDNNICVSDFQSYLSAYIDALQLFNSGPGPAMIHAKITRATGRIILEMTTDALNAGLLEACVVAAVLLQSGRNID